MTKQEIIELFYPQIHKLMLDFNKKYLKDKWEVLTDTGFLKSNTNLYLYKGNREVIISEISKDEVTHYGNFTMSDKILEDYYTITSKVDSIITEYWKEQDEAN